MGFSTMGLSDPVMQGVEAAGYTVPTPIQSLAIRPALEGRDIIGLAQTGTGKTAAFVLPLLHRLAAVPAGDKRHPHPRALVLTPTRELAQQVHAAVDTYGKFVHLRAAAIYGGVDMEKQLKLLRRGLDIAIATPGRLLDHLQRGSLSLQAVEVLVLDEADRMLDMGFIKDVRKIIAQVPAGRQTMLFSATMPDEISTLAGEVLRDPETVEVGERRSPVETIEQHFYAVSQEAKTALLLHALENEKMESVLVFARTKYGADKIARRLDRQRVPTAAIHSNRSQGQRERALEAFKSGSIRVLVATDIAARGLDVSGISHVVNYDIPHQAEDYIHRIGRTGRAGADGDAITFVAREDQPFLQRIERFTGKRVQVKSYPGFVPPPAGTQPAARQGSGSYKQAGRGGTPDSHSASHGRPAHGGGHPPTVYGGSHQASMHKGTRPSSVHSGARQQSAHSGTRPPSAHPGTRSYPPQSGPHTYVGHSAGGKRNGGTPGTPWKKSRSQKKKRTILVAARKMTPPKKLDSFSSHSGGAGWSNY
ncbi:MAG: DEAD/DEAH box helicase [Bacteroidetes bacterium]|nr:DEAD/DEAH box helicase [Bacteroidota bacterium]